MRLGVVYDPVSEELFTAIDGGGAKCNDQPIKVSDCSEIGDSFSPLDSISISISGGLVYLPLKDRIQSHKESKDYLK